MNPLAGLRIVVTRAAHQAEELAHPLRAQGAEVILLPVIGIAPPNDSGPLRAAAASEEYEWIIFTSANAVAAFSRELGVAGKTCRAKVATIGSATRESAEAHGFRVALVPDKYVAESLAAAFAGEDLSGSCILIPSAAVTRDVVAPALRRLGARVEVVEAYQNVLPLEAPEQAHSVFRDPFPEWVTFASPSAVSHLIDLIGVGALGRSNIASIGPVTSEMILKLGLQVHAEAQPHTVEGLVRAIVATRLH